ncbi:MAG: DUF4255 domain-containing protein [Chloroflexi bacterium]|nr:DUF4255 domain-containing protein [Chloroflexota bacterium]
MIHLLDETIRKVVLKRGNFDADSVTVSFDQPTGDWAAGLTRPTINFYLYDIRENTELRSQEWIAERDDKGTVSKRLAPLRYDLSYLVTVWTQNQVEDEHSILWRVLGALASSPTLGVEVLEPSLRSQPYPVQTRTAQPSRAIENLPDLWGVMENQLRPSINYTVTLSMERAVAFTSPWVISRRVDLLDTTAPEATRSTTFEIGGIVYEATGGTALPGATVRLAASGRECLTDRFGRYHFGELSAGEYDIEVFIGGRTARHRAAVPSESVQSYDISI